MKLANVILDKFVDLGVEHIIGVPGDYNLPLCRHIANHKILKWIGTCNELNASYAADGYARIKTDICNSNGEKVKYKPSKLSVLLTTYGVGELSAINGVAGAYAEDIPLVILVGMPASGLQGGKFPVHHTMADGCFDRFTEMWQKVTCSCVTLSKRNWIENFEHAVSSAIVQRKPAYISVPVDLFDLEVGNINIHLGLLPRRNGLSANPFQGRAADLIFERIKCSTKPLAWIGSEFYHDGLVVHLREFLENLSIPFATSVSSKGILPETHKLFAGTYVGENSEERIKELFSQSDCLLLFGIYGTEFETGSFSVDLNEEAIVKVIKSNVNINRDGSGQKVHFTNIEPCQLLSDLWEMSLTASLSFEDFALEVAKDSPTFNGEPASADWSLKVFWDMLYKNYLDDDDILIAETGTSIFAVWERRLPVRCRVITSSIWASIGYTVGAALGASLACQNTKRVILVVGDGSFQMASQEVSTLARNNCHVTIFLLNNNGYTIERAILGPDDEYHDISNWDYCKTVSGMCADKVTTYKVENAGAMSEIFNYLPKADESTSGVHFVETCHHQDQDEADLDQGQEALGQDREALDQDLEALGQGSAQDQEDLGQDLFQDLVLDPDPEDLEEDHSKKIYALPGSSNAFKDFISRISEDIAFPIDHEPKGNSVCSLNERM
eukprot:Nk52_evm26s295 gene=Nk52_evmTU26s295